MNSPRNLRPIQLGEDCAGASAQKKGPVENHRPEFREETSKKDNKSVICCSAKGRPVFAALQEEKKVTDLNFVTGNQDPRPIN
jgi:hypothetical protein